MPIYEYVCQGCRHGFEVKQSFSDPPVSSCPLCGQAVTKIISAPAIMFKGSGWYVTDYSDKLKPGPEAKTDDKNAPEKKQDGDSTSGATPPAAAAAASSGSTAGTAGQPAPAAPSASTPSSATTPASTPKSGS